VAKSLDKEPTPPEGNEPPPAGPSLVLIEALGDHAEQQGLVQGEDESEIAFAVRCVEKLGALVTDMDGNIRTLEEEKAALSRRLASQRGATTKAKAKIVEMEEAGKPRALGPMAEPGDDDPVFTADDLLTAIDGAEEIVLAFSDGTSELKGVKPRKVSAEAFRFTRGRLHFIEGPLEVTGPGGEDTVTTLAGVALLVDGEQVAWSPMSQAVRIGAGQTMNLAGSVIFG
jgi:hypothetical protein